MPTLPEARLQPKDAADHKTIMRGRAKRGARAAGRVAWTLTKLGLVVAVLAVGAIVAGPRTRTESTTVREPVRITPPRRPQVDWAKLAKPYIPQSFDEAVRLQESTPSSLSPSQQRTP